MLDEPPGFLQPGGELEVFAIDGSPERAGDEEDVTWLPPRAQG